MHLYCACTVFWIILYFTSIICFKYLMCVYLPCRRKVRCYITVSKCLSCSADVFYGRSVYTVTSFSVRCQCFQCCRVPCTQSFCLFTSFYRLPQLIPSLLDPQLVNWLLHIHLLLTKSTAFISATCDVSTATAVAAMPRAPPTLRFCCFNNEG